MAKNLLIVESPAKAKTIEKYLGADFKVKASYGHIRDLRKGNHAVDIEHDFQPIYEVPEEKTRVVNELRKAAREAEQVWLATDEDREGEAISWHLLQVLNLDYETTRRIVFHEITKSAIQKAVANPRKVNMDLVDAQQARRVLDRLVGFELSPVLWKKVKHGLSAGRVQSVAVRLIVEREREIAQFNTSPFFKGMAYLFTEAKAHFKAELVEKFGNVGDAQTFLTNCIQAGYVVRKIETKPATRSPAPPFITSTLQQESARKLGLSVSRTMRLAQNLYENGHITYMRTDSVFLSDTALAATKAEITQNYGDNYYQRRTFKNKTANAQEAHEAIRPTDFSARKVSNEPLEQKLYDLIWKRTVASQMADAQLERTIVDIEILPQDKTLKLPWLKATGEVIKFDGFLKLYLESKESDDHDDENAESGDNGILPAFKVGQPLFLNRFVVAERFTRPAPRYTEASLVKKLEEQGIGRPSTYAPTITTIQTRNYVVKESREGVKRDYRVLVLENDVVSLLAKQENVGADKNKLFPTDLGCVVTDFLVKHFPDIVDYSFTAKVEDEFDEISKGQMAWVEMLRNFYPPFHEKVKQTEAGAEHTSGERLLGHDPQTGKRVISRLGRYGPIVQIGEADDPDKRFASLTAGQRLESITLEQALELFKLPREVGKFEEKPMKANIGRFGPYILHDNKFYSIPQNLDVFQITETDAIGVIEAKRLADANKIIKAFDGTDFVLQNGRWGPYLAVGKHSVPLPKDKKENPAALTLAECEQLYQAYLLDPKNQQKIAKIQVAAEKAKPKEKAEKTPPNASRSRKKATENPELGDATTAQANTPTKKTRTKATTGTGAKSTSRTTKPKSKAN